MRALRPAFLPLALAAVCACGNRGAPSGTSASASTTSSSPSADASPPSAAPAARVRPEAGSSSQHNPLGLPPMRNNLQPNRRIFTIPEAMLKGAKPGSTFILQAGTVTGMDGDDLVVESRGSPSYRIHPGYVIAVPDDPRLKPGDPVLTEQGGVMRHAVVTKFIRDRVGVRYTDLEGRSQEVLLLGGSGKPTATGPSKAARFVKQTEGLQPGNYAALHQGEDWLHVQLISGFGDGEGRKWLALGFGGAAMVVNESELAPIPVRLELKVGAIIWAESGGKMRRATVQSADDRGIFLVKFERAGRPSTVGWGLVMKPAEG
ncbi:Hypothetical protein A7982_03735 [Minicystis rosea]|nr:Hypothetical protein A7982_03735 [Minicystis rosea]